MGVQREGVVRGGACKVWVCRGRVLGGACKVWVCRGRVCGERRSM